MAVRSFALLVGFLAGIIPVLAHDIITTNLTYTRDIYRIFVVRCVACHGAQASVALTTYQEVRPWAVSIKEQVLSRAMPPWGAVKGFGDFSPDYGLTQEEMTIIASWVVGGAPEGDPAALPKHSPAMPRGERSSVARDALHVQTTVTIRDPIVAISIKPTEKRTIASTRLTARLPDGQILPLLWLCGFDGNSDRRFTFRSAFDLPAGTVINSSSPLNFDVETRPRRFAASK